MKTIQHSKRLKSVTLVTTIHSTRQPTKNTKHWSKRFARVSDFSHHEHPFSFQYFHENKSVCSAVQSLLLRRHNGWIHCIIWLCWSMINFLLFLTLLQNGALIVVPKVNDLTNSWLRPRGLPPLIDTSLTNGDRLELYLVRSAIITIMSQQSMFFSNFIIDWRQQASPTVKKTCALPYLLTFVHINAIVICRKTHPLASSYCREWTCRSGEIEWTSSFSVILIHLIDAVFLLEQFHPNPYC